MDIMEKPVLFSKELEIVPESERDIFNQPGR